MAAGFELDKSWTKNGFNPLVPPPRRTWLAVWAGLAGPQIGRSALVLKEKQPTQTNATAYSSFKSGRQDGY
jgi:hypothetical protein